MIKTVPIFCFMFVTMAVCGGCYPYHFTKRPGAKGRVVDARTKAPVAGAKVDLYYNGAGQLQAPKPIETSTARNGSFVIPGEKEWGIETILPWEYTGWEVRLDFAADGYDPAMREFHVVPEGPAVTDVGTVPVNSKARNQ